MNIIINVLGNGCIQSDAFVSVTAENVMQVCDCFASEHYIMPEEIIITMPDSGKIIEINIEYMLQSELEKLIKEM